MVILREPLRSGATERNEYCVTRTRLSRPTGLSSEQWASTREQWGSFEGVLEPVVGIERFVLRFRVNSAQFVQRIKLSLPPLSISNLISLTEEFTEGQAQFG